MRTLKRTIASIIFDLRRPPQIFMPVLEKAIIREPLRLNGIKEYHRLQLATARTRE